MGAIVSQRVTACVVCGKSLPNRRRKTCGVDCEDQSRLNNLNQYELRKQRMSPGDRLITRVIEAQDACEREDRAAVLERYIRRECERVQATWSKREAIRRAGLAEQLPLTVTEVGSGKHYNGKTLERSE